MMFEEAVSGRGEKESKPGSEDSSLLLTLCNATSRQAGSCEPLQAYSL